MAFTEAQLQTAIDTAVDGAGCKIIKFDNWSSATQTDVTVQNMNVSTDKSGTCQIAQTNTATQAAAAVLAALS